MPKMDKGSGGGGNMSQDDHTAPFPDVNIGDSPLWGQTPVGPCLPSSGFPPSREVGSGNAGDDGSSLN